jgi:hypothetical protein
LIIINLREIFRAQLDITNFAYYTLPHHSMSQAFKEGCERLHHHDVIRQLKITKHILEYHSKLFEVIYTKKYISFKKKYVYCKV